MNRLKVIFFSLTLLVSSFCFAKVEVIEIENVPTTIIVTYDESAGGGWGPLEFSFQKTGLHEYQIVEQNGLIEGLAFATQSRLLSKSLVRTGIEVNYAGTYRFIIPDQFDHVEMNWIIAPFSILDGLKIP